MTMLAHNTNSHIAFLKKIKKMLDNFCKIAALYNWMI